MQCWTHTGGNWLAAGITPSKEPGSRLAAKLIETASVAATLVQAAAGSHWWLQGMPERGWPGSTGWSHSLVSVPLVSVPLVPLLLPLAQGIVKAGCDHQSCPTKPRLPLPSSPPPLFPSTHPFPSSSLLLFSSAPLLLPSSPAPPPHQGLITPGPLPEWGPPTGTNLDINVMVSVKQIMKADCDHQSCPAQPHQPLPSPCHEGGWWVEAERDCVRGGRGRR